MLLYRDERHGEGEGDDETINLNFYKFSEEVV